MVPASGIVDAAQLRHDRKRVDVGGLALVGAHAERGVALQMLDRLVAFLMRELHVLGGHVVLEIDEGLAAAPRRQLPDRLDAHSADRARSPAAAVRSPACRGRHAAAARRPASKPPRTAATKPKLPMTAPAPKCAGREAAGHEGGDRLVVARLDAAVRGQMHGRRPAAGHARRHRSLDAGTSSLPPRPASRRRHRLGRHVDDRQCPCRKDGDASGRRARAQTSASTAWPHDRRR